MWSYIDDLLARLAPRPGGRPRALDGRASAPLRYVHVMRRDKVAQAVSLWRAVQTRAWRAGDATAARQPVFDRRGIEHLVRSR